MPKEIAAPEPQAQYEGYHWLGSDWGRSGNPTPSRIGAVAMLAATVIVLGIAIRALGEDTRAIFVVVSFIVAALTGLAGTFYVAEARFAARAAREQQPEFPEPPSPSVGP